MLLLLLVVVMVISFFDRGNLAVAAPVLGPDLRISTWSLGILLSAFFWTYSVSQIGAGWLVDRMDVRWVYAGGFLLWCGATLGSSIVAGFSGLLTMRLLLGVGESVTYPATSHILAATFPEARRGLANSLIDLGARLGPALGTFCGALLLAKFGWRALFAITGAAGLLWLIPWITMAPRIEMHDRSMQFQRIGWKQLLRRRAVWGTVGGLCGANYAWYFLLSWLPSYLVRERGFTLESMAIWGSVPYLLMAFTSVGGGILADRLVARGHAPVPVRRGFLVGGLLTTAILLPTVLLPGAKPAITGLLLSCLAFGAYASNLFSLTQTLAGPEASGRWTGLQNACGNFAGIASAVITGWIVTATGQFAAAFIAASAACLGGAMSFGLLVRDSPAGAGPQAAVAHQQ